MHNKYFIIAIILFSLYLIRNINIFSTENSQNSAFPLYRNDDRRIHVAVENRVLENNTKCDTTNVMKCTSDKDCLSCQDRETSCHFFDEDYTVIDHDNVSSILPASKTEGYCLHLKNDKTSRSCTYENGGVCQLIGTGNSYSFICKCPNPNIYTQVNAYSDCTVFLGCTSNSTGNYSETSKSLSEIQCDCVAPYEFINYAEGGPDCVIKSYFEAKHDTTTVKYSIHHCFLYSSFKALFKDITNRRIPDPCKYDSLTRALIDSLYVKGHVAKDVYTCVTSHIAITFDLDTSVRIQSYTQVCVFWFFYIQNGVPLFCFLVCRGQGKRTKQRLVLPSFHFSFLCSSTSKWKTKICQK